MRRRKMPMQLITLGDLYLRSETTDYDTIIVGMGAAGITAASELARAGVKVLGLEAMDRIGGRVNTVPFGDGVVEMGAECHLTHCRKQFTHHIFPDHNVFPELARAKLRCGGLKPLTVLGGRVNTVWGWGGGVRADWIHGTESSRTYDLAVQNGVKLKDQDTMIEVFYSDGSPANASLINELLAIGMGAINDKVEKPEPLGQYLTRKMTAHIKEHYPDVYEDKEFIAEFLRFLDMSVDLLEATDSWNDVMTSGDYEELGGSQSMSWHSYGYKTLFDILLNKYNNGTGLPSLTIKLNSEVTKISYSDDPSKKVSVTTKDGATYTADNVIVTVSLGVLKANHKTLFSSPLPAEKQVALGAMSMGLLGKVVFLFPTHWWQDTEHPICFFWSAEDKKQVSEEDHWMFNISGTSTPMGSHKAMTVWTYGKTGRLVEAMNEEVVKKKFMSLIRRFMGKGIEVPEPIAMMRTNWFHNPYTHGSYSYDNLLSSQHPNARRDLGQPITDSAGNLRVLFAGEATEPMHFSTVHGATNTGHREAARLLERRPKAV